MLKVDPTKNTYWADQAACHEALRAAGAKWDFRGKGLTAADLNWLVMGLTQPAVCILVFDF